MDKTRIEEVLAPYLCLPLECDGFTRVATYALRESDIAHQTFQGTLCGVLPHFWIETERYLVDYKSRIWEGHLNRYNLPYGVIPKKAIPKDLYLDATQLELEVDSNLFSILISEPTGILV